MARRSGSGAGSTLRIDAPAGSPGPSRRSPALRRDARAGCKEHARLRDCSDSPGTRTLATAEILLWLGDEELGIPLEQISPADAERLLRLLQAPANLNDHHLRDFLKRFAPRWPELVVNLAKTRLERCLEEPAHFLPSALASTPSQRLP
jgi:hypothetical protein